jgi:tetratricopeptide (TPR) repeat protein
MTDASTAHKLVEEAQRAYQAKKYLAAASLFERAIQEFNDLGDSLSAAEMASNLSVAYLQAGDAQSALTAVQGSDQVFAQAADTQRQALALGNIAAAHESLGNLEIALETYQQCADLLKPIKGQEETRAYVLKCISSLQVRTGKQLEALASMNAALNNQKKLNLREKILHKLLRIPFKQINSNHEE